MLLCLSSLSPSPAPFPNDSPNVHLVCQILIIECWQKNEIQQGSYWVQLKTRALMGACVRACDKQRECDIEKGNRKTKSEGIDSDREQFLSLKPYMYWIIAELQRPIERCSSFLSPGQILGSVIPDKDWINKGQWGGCNEIKINSSRPHVQRRYVCMSMSKHPNWLCLSLCTQVKCWSLPSSSSSPLSCLKKDHIWSWLLNSY